MSTPGSAPRTWALISPPTKWMGWYGASGFAGASQWCFTLPKAAFAVDYLVLLCVVSGQRVKETLAVMRLWTGIYPRPVIVSGSTDGLKISMWFPN